MALTLPVGPSSVTAATSFVAHERLSGFPSHEAFIEPVGAFFEALARRQRHNRTESEDDRAIALVEAAKAAEAAASQLSGVGANEHLYDEDNAELEKYLSKLDPKEWRTSVHDLYKIMGLSKLRWKATDDDIQRTYKLRILRYHPDKRGKTGTEDEDDLFKVIKKAHELLLNKQMRRAFDSVDPQFDNTVPVVNDKNKANFYKVFGPIFERTAHFSIKQPVPELGDDKSSEDHVNEFYHFWFNFESWREFSYLDEEDTTKADNRDEKRYLEKKNTAARKQHKQEETLRVRKLVDNAYACDPRIQAFKDAEKAIKDAKKKAKDDAARAIAEAAEREANEAKRIKEEAEAAAKQALEDAKNQREAVKRVLKKERKRIRTFFKEQNYFLSAAEANNVDNISREVDRIDNVCEQLSPEQLTELNDRLEGAANPEEAKAEFQEIIEFLGKQKERADRAATRAASSASAEKSTAAPKEAKPWTPEESQLLVKAVKLYPAGTVNRWEVVVEYLHDHVKDSVLRDTTEAIAKYKELQAMGDASRAEKEKVNKQAYSALEKKVKDVVAPESAPTQRSEADAPVGEVAAPAAAAAASAASTESGPAWSAEEQRLFEHALRVVPKDDRNKWGKVSQMVPGRSKAQCIARFKEISAVVQAKKAGGKK